MAGVKGFQPLSAAAKAGFKLLARVSVYATIAEWARDMGFNALKVYQVSETLKVLLDVEEQHEERVRCRGFAVQCN